MSATQPSTGQELLDFANLLLNGQTIDEDLFLTLANIANTRLEEERPWQFLKKLNQSLSVSTGDTYATSKALPDDFRYDYKVMLGTDKELFPVPFESQHIYRTSPGRYWIDHSGNVFYLTGTQNKTSTIYFFYIKTTDAITLTTTPAMPLRFRALLAYMVVGYYQNGVDSDDVYARMSPENKLAALELKNAMLSWDANLQARSQNNQQGFANSEPELSLGNM